MITTLKSYCTENHQELLKLWEDSVLETHDFLDPQDFLQIKAMLATMDLTALEVYCLWKQSQLVGFIGVADFKIEMLFIDPYHLNQGLGTKLIRFACSELAATHVDVNQQNHKAHQFYLKHGFKVFEQTPKDAMGKDYPILKMKL